MLAQKRFFKKKMSSKPPPQQVLYNYYLLRCAVHLPFSWYLSDFNNFTSTNIQNNIVQPKAREKKNSKWNNKKCIKSDILTQKRSDEWGAPVLLRYLIPRLFVIQNTTTHFRIIM